MVITSPAGGAVAQGQRLGLDAVQDVHDAAVLQPGLVVQKAPQLLRQLRHRALGVLAGLQPVVVDARACGHRAAGPPRRAAPATRSSSAVSSSCRWLDIRKSQNARKLRPWSESAIASRSPMISSSSAPLLPSHSAMRSRTVRSSWRKLCSTSRKSVSSSRASCWNCWKRSRSAVSSSSGMSPASTRAISASISSRRCCSSAMRFAGSASLPSLICLSSSKQREQARLGADEADRSLREASQAMAFSVAGVRSNCGSSVPGR